MKANRENSYFSPAKLNLFLKIIEKKGDGYHEIHSLFQTVSLGDTITLSLASTDSFTCNDPSLQKDNLILRAVRLFRQKTNLSFYLAIHLDKKIPIGGGFGGGSSNAATTLFALKDLLDKPIAERTLAEWGGELGSDVPFFFSSGRALCQGRGEEVFDLPRKELQAWIAHPGFSIQTQQVYRAIDYNRLGIFHNDLEEAACRLEPRMVKIKESLLQMGFAKVAMTGSGSGFFCLGEGVQKEIEGVSWYRVKEVYRTHRGGWYPI